MGFERLEVNDNREEEVKQTTLGKPARQRASAPPRIADPERREAEPQQLAPLRASAPPRVAVPKNAASKQKAASPQRVSAPQPKTQVLQKAELPQVAITTQPNVANGTAQRTAIGSAPKPPQRKEAMTPQRAPSDVQPVHRAPPSQRGTLKPSTVPSHKDSVEPKPTAPDAKSSVNPKLPPSRRVSIGKAKVPPSQRPATNTTNVPPSQRAPTRPKASISQRTTAKRNNMTVAAKQKTPPKTRVDDAKKSVPKSDNKSWDSNVTPPFTNVNSKQKQSSENLKPLYRAQLNTQPMI